jgi:hypothetical protein
MDRRRGNKGSDFFYLRRGPDLYLEPNILLRAEISSAGRPRSGFTLGWATSELGFVELMLLSSCTEFLEMQLVRFQGPTSLWIAMPYRHSLTELSTTTVPRPRSSARFRLGGGRLGKRPYQRLQQTEQETGLSPQLDKLIFLMHAGGWNGEWA